MRKIIPLAEKDRKRSINSESIFHRFFSSKDFWFGVILGAIGGGIGVYLGEHTTICWIGGRCI